MNLFESMQVFDTKALPEDATRLRGWGNNHLDVLLPHYCVGKRKTFSTFFNPSVDREQGRNKLTVFKSHVPEWLNHEG